jgi:hypothetical protein
MADLLLKLLNPTPVIRNLLLRIMERFIEFESFFEKRLERDAEEIVRLFFAKTRSPLVSTTWRMDVTPSSKIT